MRTGIGYDIHRLVSERKLILAGVTIPFEKGLLGHSDADVLTHSICDALLGAAGLGDIGLFFPDSDPNLKDKRSMYFLAEINEMLLTRKYEIKNIDSIIFAEAPKFAPYREAMKANIADTLKVDPDLINIKATTAEGIGIIGKGEGIAAMSVVLIEQLNETIHDN
jgi:2-C-methyl-D-erythritol 2,4-cyclodiphosphate synthase